MIRQRLIEGAYACVARTGLARTSVEDVAREAQVSRATVYRHFPGGRDELLREAAAWEVTRFFTRMADACAGAASLREVLETALAWGHRAVDEHRLLQHLLETEPQRLVPLIGGQADRLRPLVSALLRPYAASEGEAEHLARLLVSHINAPGRWDLDDPTEVARLVRVQFALEGKLPGRLKTPPKGGTEAETQAPPR